MQPDLSNFDAASTANSPYEICRLDSVLCAYEPAQQYTMVLRSLDGGFVFAFPTGYFEAWAVENLAKGIAWPNPLTHELIAGVTQALGKRLLEAVVYSYDKHTESYQCYLAIGNERDVVKVRCRVSDAVALSLVVDMPIKINAVFLGRDK